MNNLFNPLALGKVLRKFNLTLWNKEKVDLLPKRKTAFFSDINRLARQLESEVSIVDQQQ